MPPFVYVTTHYPPNPITRDFAENALFPLVRSMNAKGANGWSAEPILTTSEQAWLETGDLNGDIGLDEDKGDTKGPLTIGVALTRAVKAQDAKVPEANTPDAVTSEKKDDAPKQQRAPARGASTR